MDPAGSRGPVRVGSARLRTEAVVFVGGALGALARVALVRGWAPAPGAWPWPTFLVNVAGAFALGAVATRLQERLPPSTYRRPFVGTGLCGGLTTFSALQIELVDLVRDDRWPLALAYLGASLASGLVAMLLATKLVRRAGLA